MPLSVTKTLQGGFDYGSPFIGPVDYRLGINVLLSGMTTAEVDINGILKPGVPLRRDGTLVSGAAQVIFGCVVEATKVATTNTVGALAAAGTKEIAVVWLGGVSRDILEDILGRVVSANEIAAFAAAGSLMKLID